MQEAMATRARELREHIFSQPASQFENNPWALANAIESFADSNGPMMIFKAKKLAIAQAELMAQDPLPRTIIEFGTFVGKSALAWGAILQDIYGKAIPSDVKVYTFDTDPRMVTLTREFVKLAGLEGAVHVLEGPGSDSLRKLKAEGALSSIDMAFFDHWEEFYLPDLQLIEELQLWRVGSLAIADNTDFPGAPKYLSYVKAGGQGAPGTVKYESISHTAEGGHGPVSLSVFFEFLSNSLFFGGKEACYHIFLYFLPLALYFQMFCPEADQTSPLSKSAKSQR